MKYTSLALAAALLFGAACSDDDDATKTASATFTTYNVGLAHGFVPKAAERLLPLTEALADLDTDVVCLQEVWLVQDDEGEWVTDQIDDFVEAMTPAYPHNFYEVTRAEGGLVGCTEEEATPLETCVVTNCDGIDPGELSGCVLAECGDEFAAVSQPCSQCLIGELGAPIEDIIEACVGGDGNSGFAYDGHNGLLIFSRHPLSNTKHTAFPAVQNARSVLEADVAIPEVGDVKVLCTHLTADLSDSAEFPSDLSDFDTYEEEQAYQVDALIQMVADATIPTVVFGDMNTGAVGNGYSSELPENYAKFTDAGWTSPYEDSANAACTYCQENTLTGDGNGNTPDETKDKLIDHVFATPDMGLTAGKTARIYDETQMIDGEDMHLSDHYGVSVEFKK